MTFVADVIKHVIEHGHFKNWHKKQSYDTLENAEHNKHSGWSSECPLQKKCRRACHSYEKFY